MGESRSIFIASAAAVALLAAPKVHGHDALIHFKARGRPERNATKASPCDSPAVK